SGLGAPATISITGGTYSIDGGLTYTSANGTVNNGDTVSVRQTSSASYSTKTDATLTIGSVSDTFSVTTRAVPPDTTPDPFTFTDQTGVPLNTVMTSNTITVSGISAAAVISITGGTYSINGGAYVNTVGTVNNNDTVTVQQTSAGNYVTKTDATLTIGGLSDTFSVTTLEAPPDLTPEQFTFNDQTDVPLSTGIMSNTITIAGISSPTPISITGGTYSINGGAYVNTVGTVNNGDTVTVQLISSGSYSTTTETTLTIGGVSETFSVNTKDEEDDNCFIATAAFGSPLAAQVQILRQFRDKYLLTHAPGRKFVSWYYRNGPVAASWIKDKPLAKVVVQTALYPLIGFSFLLISGYLPFVTMGFLLSALLFLRFRPKKLKAM
ncbi:MAG: CFI-box-CTERM domain-containing protein, partial [Smithella sp.]